MDTHLVETTIMTYLFVFSSDNGPWIDAWPDAGYGPFRGAKGTPFENGWRVPGLMWAPGRIPAGTVLHGMMSHMDIWPTTATMAGLKPPSNSEYVGNDGKPIWFDGIDNSDYVTGKTKQSARQEWVYIDSIHFLCVTSSGNSSSQVKTLGSGLRSQWLASPQFTICKWTLASSTTWSSTGPHRGLRVCSQHHPDATRVPTTVGPWCTPSPWCSNLRTASKIPQHPDDAGRRVDWFGASRVRNSEHGGAREVAHSGSIHVAPAVALNRRSKAPASGTTLKRD